MVEQVVSGTFYEAEKKTRSSQTRGATRWNAITMINGIRASCPSVEARCGSTSHQPWNQDLALL